MHKLKEFVNTGEFHIIDNFNHQTVETIPQAEAFAKYGECEVWGSYTAASSRLPDVNGNVPSWKTDVWVEIPGMKIGYWNDTNLHLRFIGDEHEATFIGRKSGQLITVTKYGADDYGIWWRDVDKVHDDLAGYSVRGTAKEIICELKGEI